METEKKNNTLMLTIVALATLLIAVVGVTFAFFTTNMDVNANIPINVHTASQAAALTALTNGEINIVADMYEMQHQHSDDSNTIDGLVDDATLTVRLNAAETGKVSKCRYDIIWVWTSEQYANPLGDESQMAYYWRTPGVAKEFTITLEALVEGNIGPTDPTNPSGGTSTINPGATYNGESYLISHTTMAEKNYDEFTVKQYTEVIDDTQNPPVTTTYTGFDLLTNQYISSAMAESDYYTSVTWTATARVYNASIAQDNIRGRTYSGYIKVLPSSVVC